MRPDPDEMGPDAEDLGRVVDILSTMNQEDSWRDEVPGDLWAGIERRLATADEPTVLASPAELRVVDPAPVEAAPAPATQVAPAAGNVVQLDERRRQRWFRAAAAAAVVVIAAGTFGVITANSPDTTQEVVASVDLEPLKERGSGTAELVTIDGVEQLRITADDLGPAPDGHHYEMWLIDAEVTDPRSLGRLPSGQDQILVDVPEGIDLDEYPIVDINVQVDGQEQHSGVETSVLRGSLA